MTSSLYPSTGNFNVKSVCLQHKVTRASLPINDIDHIDDKAYYQKIAVTSGTTILVTGVAGRQVGFRWTSNHGTGHGADTVSSGLELAWTKTPAQWSNNFFENLFNFEWEQMRSPAGAIQWVAKDAEEIIPDAHIPGKFHKPTMLTTDLTLRFDPEFGKISRRFLRTRKSSLMLSPGRGTNSRTATWAQRRDISARKSPRKS